MRMKMRILSPLKVPFDKETAEASIRLAKIMGAELEFLNVSNTTPFHGYIKVRDGVLEHMREDGEVLLKEAVELAEMEGVRTTKKYVEGNPVDEIEKAEKDADIFVIKIRRFSKDGKIGTITEEMLDRCTKPVFIFKGEHRDFNKILVTLDDSKCAREALEFSLLFAKQLGLDTISSHFVARLTERIAAGKKVLKEAREMGEKYNIKVAAHLDKGDPSREIIKLSEGFDLIIMGSTGQSAISKFFLGSTARKVAIFSKCDVIVVPPCKK